MIERGRLVLLAFVLPVAGPIWGCISITTGGDASVSTGGGPADGGPGGDGSSNPSCRDGGPGNVSPEEAVRQSCSVAIVQTNRVDEECSGLGGTHLTLEVLEIGRGPRLTLLEYGGHGYIPPVGAPPRVGEFFVAGIEAFTALRNRTDEPAWCVVGLPPVDGRAHTLLPASNLGDARTKMRGVLGL